MITLTLDLIQESLIQEMKKILIKIKLKQRVGVNIKNRDLSTYILGKKYSLPLGFSPVEWEE